MSVEDGIYISLTQLRRVLDYAYEHTMPLATVPPQSRKDLSDLFVQFALCELGGTEYKIPFEKEQIPVDTKFEKEDNIIVEDAPAESKSDTTGTSSSDGQDSSSTSAKE